MQALVTRLFCLLALSAITCTLINASDAFAEQSLELDVVVHPRTSITSLSAHQLEALFTRVQTRWSDGSAVIPLNAPTGTAAREEFDRVVLHLTPEQIGRFWLDRRIRGLGLPPRQVPDGGLLLKVIENLGGSIAYVRPELVTSRMKVVARVRQGRVVAP